jgi:hypothetical protein
VAGDAVVPYLKYSNWKDERTDVVVASAQTLRLIGTNRAKSELEHGYVDERREAVIAQTCQSGAIEYTKFPLIVEAVAETGELPRFVTVSDVALILGLKELKRLDFGSPLPRNADKISTLTNLRAVVVEDCALDDLARIDWPQNISELSLFKCTGENYEWLRDFENLKTLFVMPVVGSTAWLNNLHTIEKLTIEADDTEWAPHLTKLKELSLVDAHTETKLGPLSECGALESLNVTGNMNVDEFSVLGSLQNLKTCRLDGTKIATLKMLKEEHRLQCLALSNCPNLNDVDAARSVPLVEFTLSGNQSLRSVDGVAAHSTLERLAIVRCSSLPTLPSHSLPPLEKLALVFLPIRKIPIISSSPRLVYVRIEDCSKIDSLEPLAGAVGVESLYLEGSPRVDSLKVLSNLKRLKKLFLINMPSIEDLDPLEQLVELEECHLVSCREVPNVIPLGSLPRLKKLVIHGCPKVVDVSPLIAAKSLVVIGVSPSDERRMQIPEILRAKVQEETHFRYGTRYRPRFYFDRTMWRFFSRRRIDLHDFPFTEFEVDW